MHAASENVIGTINDAVMEASRTAALDVAAWLLIPGLAGQNVSLSVVYDDGRDHHEVLVDEGEVDSNHRILLANITQLPLPTSHEPARARVVLRSPKLTRGVVVESLYVKPIEPRSLLRSAN
jgi:hypothetical protein